MSDSESAEQYLSIEIHQIKKKICLIQIKYITDMLKQFNMKDCVSKSILMKKKIQLDIDVAGESLCKTDKEYYQQAIESLLYLSLETRSDISFAVAILSQFTVNSHEKYKITLNQIFYYFRNTLDIEIIYYAAKSLILTD